MMGSPDRNSNRAPWLVVEPGRSSSSHKFSLNWEVLCRAGGEKGAVHR